MKNGTKGVDILLLMLLWMESPNNVLNSLDIVYNDISLVSNLVLFVSHS